MKRGCGEHGASGPLAYPVVCGGNSSSCRPWVAADARLSSPPPPAAPQLHLHGHWFWVMAQGRPNAGTYNPSTPLNPTPILRDTATVNAGSYLVLRFVASNRGVWIFHCEGWQERAGAGG